jgi:hypothetical protein
MAPYYKRKKHYERTEAKKTKQREEKLKNGVELRKYITHLKTSVGQR